MRFAVLCLLASTLLPSPAQDKVPVFVITQEDSSVQFSVKASVALEGKFDKWDASLTFPSTDVTTGVLDIKIQAATVNTGSGMKDDKLRSKDFFDVKQDPFITFHSNKVVQTGPPPLICQARLPFAASLSPRPSPLRLPARVQGQATLKGPWHSTVRNSE